VEAAKALKVDLICIGTHGRGGLAHFILGSVAEKVIRNSPCPVLTLRPAVVQH
jgi:nucleotide-binding universal stress UspA family protein